MRIYKCKNCPKIHLEIGNVLLHFGCSQQLREYLCQLEDVDTSYFAAKNKDKGLSKDIFLSVANTSVNLAFTVEEFDFLKKTIYDYLDETESSVSFVKIGKSQAFFLN